MYILVALAVECSASAVLVITQSRNNHHKRRLFSGFGGTRDPQFWGTSLKFMCVSLCILD